MNNINNKTQWRSFRYVNSIAIDKKISTYAIILNVSCYIRLVQDLRVCALEMMSKIELDFVCDSIRQRFRLVFFFPHKLKIQYEMIKILQNIIKQIFIRMECLKIPIRMYFTCHLRFLFASLIV